MFDVATCGGAYAGGRVRRGLFAGTADAVAAAKACPAGTTATASMADAAFAGRAFRSWDEVAAAVLAPWPDGLAVVERMLERLREVELPAPKVVRRRGCWSEDAGDEVSIDRMQTGDPYWRTTTRRATYGPRAVSIYVDVAANAGVKANDILWRGAACVAAVSALEDAGYRCEVHTLMCSRGAFPDGRGYVCRTTVKEAGDALDVAGLVNAVSGWYFRSVGFAGVCLEPGHDPGLGRHVTPDDAVLDIVGAAAERHVIKDCWSFDAAAACAADLLRNFA